MGRPHRRAKARRRGSLRDIQTARDRAEVAERGQAPERVPAFSTYTVANLLSSLADDLWSSGRIPVWPPDAFAMAASVLQKADAYSTVIASWPPKGLTTEDWQKQAEGIARAWRSRSASLNSTPKAVAGWWGVVRKHEATPIEQVRDKPDLCQALLQICCVADEAAAGAGIVPGPGETRDPFQRACWHALSVDHAMGSTLCREVKSGLVGVMPKLHTPQSGLTLRSLTHHLALINRSDVTAVWDSWWLWREKQRNHLNLLLLPWPMRLRPQNFSPSRGPAWDMPEGYGFFKTTELPAIELDAVERALAEAERIVDDVDWVVFPEAALRPDQVPFLSTGLNRPVIGGEAAPPVAGRAGINKAVISLPISEDVRVVTSQHKHHRWRMSERQVNQYALRGRLEGARDWWEDIGLPKRIVHFQSVVSWLSLCVLVCEDLARQDPVGEIMRAVGPDLVIALLMDGPQLSNRWPARYAAVLADDPGSSVLTLTSLGMTRLSCASGHPESRVVAMWQEADKEVKELSLFQGSIGLVLSLRAEQRGEHSADGRSDSGVATHLTLEQVHQVYEEPSIAGRRPRR